MQENKENKNKHMNHRKIEANFFLAHNALVYCLRWTKARGFRKLTSLSMSISRSSSLILVYYKRIITRANNERLSIFYFVQGPDTCNNYRDQANYYFVDHRALK